MSKLYGLRVISTYAKTSVIGPVEKSVSNNTILRVGKMNQDGSWTQTEHVVLTPDELREFIAELQKQE